MFVRVWAGERDLVTILVSTISFLTYISVVMDYVTTRVLNRLPPNDPYMGRTEPLTSKRCIYIFIQQI